jgi:hypothetical protein
VTECSVFDCSNFAEQDRVCAAGKRAPAAHGVVGGHGAGAAELVAPAAETAPTRPSTPERNRLVRLEKNQQRHQRKKVTLSIRAHKDGARITHNPPMSCCFLN